MIIRLIVSELAGHKHVSDRLSAPEFQSSLLPMVTGHSWRM